MATKKNEIQLIRELRQNTGNRSVSQNSNPQDDFGRYTNGDSDKCIQASLQLTKETMRLKGRQELVKNSDAVSFE